MKKNIVLITIADRGISRLAYVSVDAGDALAATLTSSVCDLSMSEVLAHVYGGTDGLDPKARLVALCRDGTHCVSVDTDREHTYNTYKNTRPQGSSNPKWLFGWLLREVLGFRKCDGCGRWLSPSDMDAVSEYDRGTRRRLCSACLASEPKTLQLHSYHGDSTGSGTEGAVRGDNGTTYAFVAEGAETEAERAETIGFELEVSNPERSLVRSDGRFPVTDAYHAIRSHFKHERDGSIGGGVEFITQVWTLRHFRDSRDVETLCECARALGAEDSDPRTGLHFHLPKTMFGATPIEQAKTLIKVMAFVTEYRDDFVRLSKRDPRRMSYCAMIDAETMGRVWERVKADEAAGRNPFERSYDAYGLGFTFGNDHSQFINARGTGATIEFRFLKSTTDAVLLRDYAEFLVGLVKGMRTLRFESVYTLGKALKAVPSDTLNRFRAAGCFLKTHATVTRGKAY